MSGTANHHVCLSFKLRLGERSPGQVISATLGIYPEGAPAWPIKHTKS